MSESNSDEIMREYRAEMAEGTTQGMSAENVKILEQAKAEQQAKAKPREGWIQKGENFYTFANYDNLPMEYKQIIPRINKWKSSGPLTDPFDGKQYIFGMTQFDNGGTSVWSKLATSAGFGSGAGGAARKAWYKFRYAIQDEMDAFNAKAAAVNEDRNLSLKTQGVFPIRTTTKNPDGSITSTDKLIHVAYVQERIEYG